ncbi:Store-operated calcium entry-associated regulatory factor [Varanus komodoensis]|nr:Store-operated calcium entry-associated regulatory factor [Varanus komodoensis]
MPSLRVPEEEEIGIGGPIRDFEGVDEFAVATVERRDSGLTRSRKGRDGGAAESAASAAVGGADGNRPGVGLGGARIRLFSKRILLREIQALTLYAGKHTNYRRTSPVPQLQCTGGSAGCSAYAPEVVQCYNKGWDGYDVQWECKAQMDVSYRFGKIEVSCEGYDYPDDPYILKGSCGLEYTLELTKNGQHDKTNFFGGNHYSTTSHDALGSGAGLVLLIVFAVLVFGVYKMFLCDNRPQHGFSSDAGHSGTSWQDHQRPPPPGFKSDGPAYQSPPPPGFKSNFTGHLRITHMLLTTTHGLIQLLHLHLVLQITLQHFIIQGQGLPLVLEAQKEDEPLLQQENKSNIPAIQKSV